MNTVQRGWWVIELVVVIISVVALLTLIRLNVNIGVALMVEGLLIVLLTKPLLLPDVLTSTLVSERTDSLILASLNISLLVELYESTKLINKLGDELLRLVKKPYLVIASLPAVMGLLPIAGGALMSAPLVETAGVSIGLNTALMSFLNVWFRHTIYLVYPMSQALITVAALTNHSVSEIATYQIPVMVIMIIVGVCLTRRGSVARSRSPYEVNDSTADVRKLSIYVSPIIASIVAALAIRPLLLVLNIYGDYCVALGGLTGVILVVMISSTCVEGRVTPAMLFSALKSERVTSMVLSSFGAMLIYHAMIITGISASLGVLINSSGFPAVAVEVLLPGVLSLISGSSVAGIASSIPLMANLTAFSLGDASLIYISSFLFYMVSPTHLCLVFTVQYFKESLMRVYKYLIPAIVVLLTFILAYYYSVLSMTT
ncbi:MAG: DUF401 family protein [Zestosphaera sp.]